jgi:hypothetical protein
MSRTFVDPDFEPRVADWLEADPDTAPAAVLATVVAAFPLIRQRPASRVPRRLQTMNRFVYLGAAAAIVVAAGLGGVALTSRGIGLAPTPTATPAPSATSAPVSPSASPISMTDWVTRGMTIAGASAAVPPSWARIPATQSWQYPSTHADEADNNAEVFHTDDPDVTYSVASQGLPDGVTYDSWVAAYRQPVVDELGERCFPAQTAWVPVTIDGRPGGRYSGCAYLEALVLADNRVYVITLSDASFLGLAPEAIEAKHLALFEALLSTVKLYPSAALDATSP